MKKYVEYYCKNNSELLKTVADGIIIHNFGWIPQRDYDDFYSIAHEVLWNCEKTFDSSKGAKFETYLIGCLTRKFKTRVTYLNRKSRNSGLPEISLQKPVDSENKIMFGETIPYQTEAENDGNFVQRYLDGLTKTQKMVAMMLMDGFNIEEIQKHLNLPERRFKMILKRMRSEEKSAPLYEGRLIV